MQKYIQIVIIPLIFLITLKTGLVAQKSIPADFCISEEEYQLFQLINDYRTVMKLPEIQLSNSLSFVARQHINDLIEHRPDTNTCNFHSWSDKGSWTPCCFERDQINKNCMQKKPSEITNYPGKGYEIVYWENKQATSIKAMNQWKEILASRAIISSFEDWENYRWQACGVAIEKGFAIAWFGEELDTETETRICGKSQTIKNEPPANDEHSRIVADITNRYYLIFGSFNDLEDAKKLINKYLVGGFNNAKIISKDNKFRISLADYPSKEQANEAKNALPDKYRDAWIMPF